VEGDVIGWLRDDVFAWSYTPLKGGLYGAIIISTVVYLLVLFAPHLVTNVDVGDAVTRFLLRYSAVAGLAYSAATYVFVRTAGPVSSYALTIALLAYGFNATHISLVARARANLPHGIRAVVPLLLVLASFVASLIHDHLHSSKQVAAANNRRRAAAKQ
jgi:hypothetical protein